MARPVPGGVPAPHSLGVTTWARMRSRSANLGVVPHFREELVNSDMAQTVLNKHWPRVLPAVTGIAFAATVLVGVPPASADPSSAQHRLFGFTGATQPFTIPDGVYSMSITVVGGGGGHGDDSGGSGGAGAKITGQLAVTPGDIWSIDVGGRGASRSGGWGGYQGGDGGKFNGGGGGGATTMNNDQTIPVVVAGGGGGGAAGSSSSCVGGKGGEGGDADTDAGSATSGANGECVHKGGGGEASAYFTKSGVGNIIAGSKGGDGSSGDAGGGGGGGGYGGGKGGGAGSFAGGGGGGGGSYAGMMVSPSIAPDDSSSDGSVALSWAASAAVAAAPPSSVVQGKVSASDSTSSTHLTKDHGTMAAALVGPDHAKPSGGGSSVGVTVGLLTALAVGLIVVVIGRRRRRRDVG